MTGSFTNFNVQIKDSLLQRLGGKRQLDMALFTFCQRIQDDAKLQPIYGHFRLESLLCLQKELLMLAFMDGEKEECNNKVMLHHYRLFQVGLNGSHFDLLKEHFADALRESWVEDDIVDESIGLFEELRPLFTEKKHDFGLLSVVGDQPSHFSSGAPSLLNAAGRAA